MKYLTKYQQECFAVVQKLITFVPIVPAKPLYNAQIGRSSFFIGIYFQNLAMLSL